VATGPFFQAADVPNRRTKESEEQGSGEMYFICGAGKGQSRFNSTAGHEDTVKELRYSSTLSLTSALDGSGL
jgi:hypothetical protein